MDELEATLSLAECVADEARRLGFEAAVIGGAALAARGYARATIDIDLAVDVEPRTKLRSLHVALEALGLESTLKLPEDDYPIGGTIVVKMPNSDSGWVAVVEVVNFSNPGRRVPTPAATAIARARPLANSALRCVTLEDLVALKL